jgi:PAS domain S-box-containing protein
MSSKPTYEELEKRVEELEIKVTQFEKEEESLRETLYSYYRLVALAPDVFAINRMKDGRYLQINDAFCHLTGYSTDEVIGRTAEELNLYAGPEERGRLLNALRRHGPIDGIEMRYRAKDGTILDCLVSARRIRFQGKGCLLAVTTNITPLAKAQRALRESEEKYRNILETMEEGYYEVDLHGNFTFLNDALCHLYGYPRDELMRMTYTQYLSPEEAKRVYRILNEVFRTGVPAKIFDHEVIAKDGSRKIIEISSALRRSASGDPIGFRGVARDVTEKVNALNALREREESYRSVVDLAPDSILITRVKDGRFMQVNQTFCQIMGYSAEELIGRTVSDVNLYVDPADRKRVLEAARHDGRASGVETPVRNREGTVRDELVSARFIRFRGEECMLVIATNITTLKAAQRALRESEEKYRNILETMEEGYYENDLAGNFTFCNETVLKFFGLSREQIIGTNYRDYLSAETAKRLDASFRDIYRTGIPAEIIDYEVIAKDGSTRTIELSASLLRNASGEPIGFRGITRDMTERRKAEKAFRESEARFRTIFETASDPIFLHEMGEGRFLDVNRAGCKHLGYTKEELIHMSIRDVVEQRGTPEVSEQFSQMALDQSSFYESLHVRKDGTKVPVEVSSGMVEQEGREVILSIIRDITERRRAEAELAKYREHLEERVLERTQALEAAQKELVKQEKLAVLGQLTATVSHELRNPLGVIRSSNFYLQRKVKSEDEKVRKHFNRIEEQVGRCDAIVGELLEYSRGRRVEAVEAEIDHWIGQLLDELAESEKIKIKRVPSQRLPPIPHDQEKMRRVMINVVDNAIQAVKAKQEIWDDENSVYYPEIRVATRVDEDDVFLEIADNGIGMDENTRERAFEPLFTTRAKGTGIGLANVQKIVTEHGGAVVLTSDFGTGTKVTIRLPRKVRPGKEFMS